MSELFAAFGVDWRLLLIHLINFGALLLALWYFLYEPLTKMLETRRLKVAQGVEDAERAAEKLAAIEAAKKDIMSAAGKEADDVLKKARAAGIEKEHSIIAASEAAAARRLKEVEAEALEMKAQALQESKKEVAKLVVLGMEKLAQNK